MTISVNDLINHLQMTPGGAPVEELQTYLDASIRVVEARCGPIQAQETTLRCRANGKNLVLPVTHLRSVSAVRAPDGSTVTVDERELNLLAGIIPVPSVRPGWWEVDVKIGTDDVPADLELAVFIVASHLWEIKRGRAGRPQAYYGGENSDTQDVPRGFAVPARAAELMRPYVMPGFA